MKRILTSEIIIIASDNGAGLYFCGLARNLCLRDVGINNQVPAHWLSTNNVSNTRGDRYDLYNLGVQIFFVLS